MTTTKQLTQVFKDFFHFYMFPNGKYTPTLTKEDIDNLVIKLTPTSLDAKILESHLANLSLSESDLQCALLIALSVADVTKIKSVLLKYRDELVLIKEYNKPSKS